MRNRFGDFFSTLDNQGTELARGISLAWRVQKQKQNTI